MRLDDWPSAQDALRVKLDEATSATKRLGHDTVGWFNQGSTWITKCRRCFEQAVVKPRGLGHEIGGPAAFFRCRP